MSDIGPTSGPLVPRLPQTTRAFVRKYRRLAPELAPLPQPIVSSLVRFDANRVLRGAQPISTQQTAQVLATALLGQQATAERKRTGLADILGNVVGDVRDITSAIPRLPRALVQEVSELPQMGSEISRAIDEAPNLGEAIRGVTQAPGIRMLPGAYLAGNIAAGDTQEIAENPLLNVLDIAPYAKRAFVSPANKAGKALGMGWRPPGGYPLEAQRRALEGGGEAVGAALTPLGRQAVRPIRAAKAKLAPTIPGQFLQQAFGGPARQLSALESQFTQRLQQEFNPSGPATADAMTSAARAANTLRTKYTSIPEDRMVEISRMMQEAPDQLDNLSDIELGFVNEYKTILDDVTAVAKRENWITEIDGEIYDPRVGRKLLNMRADVENARQIQDVRQLLDTPPDDIPSMLSEAASATLREGITKGQRVRLIQGYAYTLDRAGFDSRPIRQTLRLVDRKKATWDDVANQFRNYDLEANRRPLVDTEEIVTALGPRARTDPTLARFVENVRQGQYTAAAQIGRSLKKRAKYGVPQLDEYLDTIHRLGERQKYLTKLDRDYSPAALARKERAYERTVAHTPPDRFVPVIQARMREELKARYTDHPDFDKITQAIAEDNYASIPGMKDEVKQLAREVEGTWQDLKANGVDPIFVHWVRESKAASLDYPHVIERLSEPTQARRRAFDITPHIQDATVAISHQGLELLTRRASQEFVRTMTDTFGKSRDDLLQTYLPAARARAARNPTMDVRGWAERAMNKEWVSYHETGFSTWSGVKLSALGDDQVMLPRALARNMELMHTPPANRLTSTLDPVMGAFRTSLLPLSPRWHVYNILGGMVVGAATDIGFLKHIVAGRRLAKAGELPEQIPRGYGQISREFREWDRSAYGAFHFRAGSTLGRLYEKARKARELGSGIVEKSYAANAFFDDMYRSAAYLRGFDKALRTGLSKAEAQSAGIALARRMFQRWDEMTPIERMTMRFVFPFYGWTSFIMKYVYNYPFDHPVRTAIVGSFARNELNDLGNTFPDHERLLSSFFLGRPDAKGHVKTLSLSGVNPFRDVGNFMTLAGFMSASNPLISTLAETMGVDPRTGNAELFPELDYDPNTGRLTAQRRDFLSSLVGNVIPQSQILMGLMGATTEYKELLRRNPEAARRLLQSQAGLPVVYRPDYPVYEEQFKSELARSEAQRSALSRGYRSGDFDEAAQYPGLKPLVRQIEELRAQGELGAFTPPDNTPSTPELLKQVATLGAGR